MGFDAELVPYCGKVFRVQTHVETFIDERTGYIRRMKTPAVILDGVYCQSRYNEITVFCPRGIYAGEKSGWSGSRRTQRAEKLLKQVSRWH
jgi:hypothetical protein